MLGADDNTLILYYVAADISIAMATSKVQAMHAWPAEHGQHIDGCKEAILRQEAVLLRFRRAASLLTQGAPAGLDFRPFYALSSR